MPSSRSLVHTPRNSCTILVNDKPICIRDDNSWKNCSSGHEVADFVRAVEEAWHELNPGNKQLLASDASDAQSEAAQAAAVVPAPPPSRPSQAATASSREAISRASDQQRRLGKRQAQTSSSFNNPFFPSSTPGNNNNNNNGQQGNPPNPASVFVSVAIAWAP